jgi:hypothetical protein
MLGYEPLEAENSSGLDQVSQIGAQLGGFPNRISEAREDVLAQQCRLVYSGSAIMLRPPRIKTSKV